jgi:hypothetical protein
MKLIKAYTLGLVLASLTLLITACSGGGSSALVAPPNPNVALTASYKVEYVPGAPANPTMGKTTFQLRITKLSDGTPATLKNVSLMPIMHMPTKDHSTPVDGVTESSTLGTYDCTVYYIMPSSDVDHWELNVTISGESATFSPAVGGGMGSSTKLKGQSDDLIKSMMMGTENRSYLLFKDSMTTTNEAVLFISAAGNEWMTFSSIYTGATLTDETDTPRTITVNAVEATTDPTNVLSWATGTNIGGGHWTVPINPPLASMATGTIYIRLTVDGKQKSTDGLATSPTSTNGYATIVVTEGM